jgi:hypothetical protein
MYSLSLFNLSFVIPSPLLDYVLVWRTEIHKIFDIWLSSVDVGEEIGDTQVCTYRGQPMKTGVYVPTVGIPLRGYKLQLPAHST